MSTTSRNRKFEDPEGLRALLTRLHRAGRGAWRDDPEAAALMRHTAEKYAALARKHGLDPWEAATAAFDAMRNPSVRRAEDPWAVVTHAVRITCLAEERGQGLLCSVTRARRPQYSRFHDAERFGDRDNPLTDYHPAFHSTPVEEPDESNSSTAVEGSTSIGSAVEDTITLFALLGWPAATARTGIEYICARLTEAASRASAFEALRRDFHARALLDIPGKSWLAMLRAVLGNPDADLVHTTAGRGILLRLLIGEPLDDLLADDALLADVVLSAPSGRSHG
ncbi:hypothetical protein [Sinomonas sp. P47F7]|uniref:hypothetical protein n=1 Tax=Sinomonas sp. P47F7 TaxID=3410987 RepID=UPI003BF57AE7